MATLTYTVVYPSGGFRTDEFTANSDRQLLHYLASALNAIVEGKITNVKVY